MAALDAAVDIAGEDLDDVEFVASGGSGTVYRAVQRSLGRIVAVKVLHGVDLRDGRTGREARVQAQMSWHANVVTLYGITELVGATTGLVMEYVPGGSLAGRLVNAGPLDITSWKQLAIELASALAAAHDAGIIHRDVKPSNVLFAADGTSRLADFGISGTGTRTLEEVEASVAYAAPELLEGDRPSATNDVFGLALTLLVAASGRHPFGEDAPVAALAARIQSERIRFSDHAPDFPPRLVDFMDRCLDLEPDERPTAAEIRDFVSAHQGSSDVSRTSRVEAGSVLSLRNVSVFDDRYGFEQRLLDGVTFRIPAGSITALVGANESGARLALKVAAGEQVPSSGSVRCEQRTSDSVEQDIRVVHLSPSPQFFPALSVRRNLAYMASLAGIRRADLQSRVSGVAERAYLTDHLDIRASKLSELNLRRLHFAMALAVEPDVLLIDVGDLDTDVTLREEVLVSIAAAAGRGIAIGLFSSDLSFVARTADRFVAFKAGRVVAEGSREAIAQAHGQRVAIVHLDQPTETCGSGWFSSGAPRLEGGSESDQGTIAYEIGANETIDDLLPEIPEVIRRRIKSIELGAIELHEILGRLVSAPTSPSPILALGTQR